VNIKDAQYREEIKKKMLMRSRIAVNLKEAIQDEKLGAKNTEV